MAMRPVARGAPGWSPREAPRGRARAIVVAEARAELRDRFANALLLSENEKSIFTIAAISASFEAKLDQNFPRCREPRGPIGLRPARLPWPTPETWRTALDGCRCCSAQAARLRPA